MEEDHVEVNMNQMQEKADEAREKAMGLDKKSAFVVFKIAKEIPKQWNSFPREDQVLLATKPDTINDPSDLTPEGQAILEKIIKKCTR